LGGINERSATVTNRERLLSIMSGKPPDRIPWIPRLLLWYNAHKKADTLPERYRGWTQCEIERDLNLGTPARDGRVFTTQLHNVEVKQTPLNAMETLHEYVTPVGTVTTATLLPMSRSRALRTNTSLPSAR
jgi:hypothetical protein